MGKLYTCMLILFWAEADLNEQYPADHPLHVQELEKWTFFMDWLMNNIQHNK